MTVMAGVANSKGLGGAIRSSLGGMSKKDARREQLLEISNTNIAIVDELIGEMRRLSDKGQTKEFNKLADITQKILDNNAKFQAVVGEVLSDTK